MPLTFSGAEVDPLVIELGGNFSVITALAPGARFVIGGGAASSEPEPSVVPAIVTCTELMVTFPLFVTVTWAT